jgi:hypothetical protein
MQSLQIVILKITVSHSSINLFYLNVFSPKKLKFNKIPIMNNKKINYKNLIIFKK